MKIIVNVVCAAAIGLGMGAASADSIVIDGETYSDVLIVTTDNMHYVKVPAEGRVITVRRSDIPEADVVITESREEKSALEKAWEESRAGREDQKAGEQLEDLPPAGEVSPEILEELKANQAKALEELKGVQANLPPAFQGIDVNNLQNLDMNSPEVQALMQQFMQDPEGTKKAVVQAVSQQMGISEDQAREMLNAELEKNGLMGMMQGGF